MARLNIVAAAIAHLNSAGYPAFASVPDGERVGKPARFCVVGRTSGASTPLVDHPSLSVDCHAATPYLASVLAGEVKGAMWAFVAEPAVMRVECGGEADYSDVMDGCEGMYRLSYSLTVFEG